MDLFFFIKNYVLSKYKMIIRVQLTFYIILISPVRYFPAKKIKLTAKLSILLDPFFILQVYKST